MEEKQYTPQQILEKIRHNYLLDKLVVLGVYAIAFAVFVFSIFYVLANVPLYLSVVFACVITLVVVLIYSWYTRWYRLDLGLVARQLNRSKPALEESTHLLLKPKHELSRLELLQCERIKPSLLKLANHKPYSISKTLPLLSLLGMLLLSGAILAGSRFLARSNQGVMLNVPLTVQKDAAQPIQGIASRSINITPPAYTGLSSFKQNDAITAPQGSELIWKLTMSHPTDSLCWVLNETQRIWLKPKDNEGRIFEHQYILSEAGFYYWEWAEGKSPYFSMEPIPDHAPQITVRSPEAYMEVQWGDPLYINLQGTLQDDYGLRNAEIIATIAKGSGEAVTFKEHTLPLGVSFASAPKQLNFSKQIDLQDLNLEWGDELYMYLQAWDNHKGYTRSETYIVHLEDTAITEYMDDLTLGVNPVPDYFRSQRQIIIDTETLLKEQKSIPQALFQERANDIGVDQKILRLRYGAFLGEEFETTSFGLVAGKQKPEPAQTGAKSKNKKLPEGHQHDDGHDHSDHDYSDHEDHSDHNHGHDHGGHSHGAASTWDGTGPDITELLEPYYHKHDVDEAATFFEPAVKAKLKAALAQMWEAELRLRTFRPKEALPFEYKALRLLKEVQQSSRTYVRKSGFETPPIKESEKRLKGELTAIQSPVQSRQSAPDRQYEQIQKAVRLLEQPLVIPYRHADIKVLEAAGVELGQAAIEQPGHYMAALQHLRRIITTMEQERPLAQAEIRVVQAAFIALVPAPKKAPSGQGTRSNPLADRYFKNIK
jgi:hypothetical protein